MSKAAEIANSLELIHKGKWCNEVELGAVSELRRLNASNAELLEALQALLREADDGIATSPLTRSKARVAITKATGSN